LVTKKEKTYLTYAAIGIVLLLVLNYAGYLGTPIDWPFFKATGDGGTKDTQTIDQMMRANYLIGIGKFEVQSHSTDSCDPSASWILTTDFNVLWYRYNNGKYTKLVTETGGTDYVAFNAQDGGYAYICVEPVTAKYIDYKETLNDPYIVGYQYWDIDGDNTKEFVFQYDLKDHSIPSSGYPVLDFYTYQLTYDTTFAISDLANITGIGTSVNNTWIEYYGTISAEKKGIAVYKIEFKITTTDETKARLKSMTVPGFGTLSGDSFDKDITSTELKWTYTFSSNFDKALYLKRMPKDITKLYFHAEVEYLLAGSDDLLTSFTIYQLAGLTEAGLSDADTLYSQEA